jgi:hypothetical protein
MQPRSRQHTPDRAWWWDAQAAVAIGVALMGMCARVHLAALSRQQNVDAEYVAVRSSGTAEDAADTPFAGMFSSFMNVRGTEQLLASVRNCWASLLTARATAYRGRNKRPGPAPRSLKQIRSV